MSDKIKILKAAEHNLKSIDVEIPHNSLTVITGVSGSGKSSLAYDVLYKESQRRYLESFSNYSRQYIGKLNRPDVEKISGLKPALAIDQKTVTYNPRSTVGTMSQIYDFLRILFAKSGKVICSNCGEEVTEKRVENVIKSVQNRYQNREVNLFAQIVDGHTGTYKSKLAELKSKGIEKVLIDDQLTDLSTMPDLDKSMRHSIWALTQRVKVEASEEFNKLVKEAFDLGKGVVKIESGGEFERVSLKHHCTNCNSEIPEIGSRLFSFNSKYGACSECNGLGLKERIDPELLLADKTKTLREGALVPTTPTGYIVYSQVTVDALNEVCNAHGFDVETPWNQLSEEQQNVIWYGSEKVQIPFGKHSLESRLKWSGITAKPRELGYYKGMLPIMEEILKRDRNDNILRFVSSVTCPHCNGTRLRKEARSVFINDKNISEIAAMPIADLKEFLSCIELTEVTKPIVKKLQNRIESLIELGLDYLTTDREAVSLSGGEAQRIRLATQVGTGLQGVLYIFDEPSVGLHSKDNHRLINLMKKIRDNGNTVVVVEHDEETIRAADYVIDIGPYAGINGGELIFNGKAAEINEESITGKFLTGKEKIDKCWEVQKSKKSILIKGASQFNLKKIDVEFKVGMLNLVTGVSGAGKSTLVHSILGKALRQQLGSTKEIPGEHSSIEGLENFSKLIEIDQSPIGRTPRSNPATYTKLFDLIRDLFASLPESKERKYKKGRFSFNNKGGRCETCQGAGVEEIGMHFLANSEVICEECNGKRFNEETLEIKYKEKNIYEVLELSIEEAIRFFNEEEKILKILHTMNDLGIGYLKLGQPSTTLSGGEAQRVKLASELQKQSKGKTLYILDEPTNGLHSADIKILLKAFADLIKKGNTIIVIEHNIDFIKTADWIVDLGPDGGNKGGEVVASGTPEEIAQTEKSYTGEALRKMFSQRTNADTDKEIVPENILIKNAKANNLKNIDVEIPVNKTTVITGVSGSGKSSIAFDTLYAEARNRFTESFSPNARRMIGKIKEAGIEECYGITPAIAVNQKTSRSNPRSTVGTSTDLFDNYRLLFSRIGIDKKTSEKAKLPASMFSFNNHSAACEECKGLGIKISASPEKLVTYPGRSLLKGALDGTKTGKFYGDEFGQYTATLKEAGKYRGVDFSNSFNELNKEEIDIAMYGTGEKEYEVEWEFKRKERTGVHKLKTKWIGFVNLVNDEYERKQGSKRGEALELLMEEIACPVCKGKRFKEQILNVVIGEKNIFELSQLTICESIEFFQNFNQATDSRSVEITKKLVSEVLHQLATINKLGLGYLSAERRTSTLSGGELQRLKLANQLNAELSGVTYVLDEPSIGLHPRDTKKLIEHIKEIQKNKNTVVIVEHDEEVIKSADYIIDVGPGAGNFGGEIIAQGKSEEVFSNENSVTAKAFNEELNFRKERSADDYLEIKNASANNLKNVNVKIPLGNFVTVTGVSGSGKTSLVYEVIAKSIKSGRAINCSEITGFEKIENLVEINQNPIGTTPLSNILTYTGMFDKIRDLFAGLPESKEAGMKKNHFSFNSKEGRCEECSGMGSVKTGMDFLADVWTLCDVCKGKRYKEEVLKFNYNGYNIFEILELNVGEAEKVFESEKKIFSGLKILNEVGLNYIKLGQPTNTMSGGEIQRLKLANEIINNSGSKNLYLFDEPTTGLHKLDVKKLLILFNKLVDEGHSVIVVEHNLDIIKNCDRVIDVGPEAGKEGGEIIFEGTPEELISCENSYTGKELKLYIKKGI
ncbi:MAG: excinuclease ABC subunit UvrA [Rhodothermaceae bacterium]